jgi:hypothetical protein
MQILMRSPTLLGLTSEPPAREIAADRHRVTHGAQNPPKRRRDLDVLPLESSQSPEEKPKAQATSVLRDKLSLL